MQAVAPALTILDFLDNLIRFKTENAVAEEVNIR